MATNGYLCLPDDVAESLVGYFVTVRGLVQGNMQGSHRSPNFGSSVEFAEYRRYSPGDPVSRIDWSVYARTDKYVIRRFQEETNLRAIIMLDSSESLGFSGNGGIKFDYAKKIAAAMMYVLVHQGDSAGLVLFDKKITQQFEPVSSMDGLGNILKKLDEVNASGKSDIEESINAVAQTLSGKTLVVVVSDFLQEPDSIIKGINRLRHDGHEVTLFHVMDKGELELGFDGVAEISELETGRKLLVEADEVRESYHRAVEEYLDKLSQGATLSGADYCLTNTDVSVRDAIAMRAVLK
jgi:uncharacterized protein (DUF58 family)